MQNPQPTAEQPITLGEWMLTIFLTAIPIVNIIMLFVWAFGSTTNLSKANWAKATLIWIAIMIVFYVLIIAIVGVGMMSDSY
ncbi:MAG: hypothetical protein WBG01_17690 [Bacteroidota bacterium]